MRSRSKRTWKGFLFSPEWHRSKPRPFERSLKLRTALQGRGFKPELVLDESSIGRNLCKEYSNEEVVLVGDHGMIGKTTIERLRKMPGMGWITALKSTSIRALVEEGQMRRDLFDERNLLEIRSPAYPGERLMAFRNPSLARLRAKKRKELLAATQGSGSDWPGRGQGNQSL